MMKRKGKHGKNNIHKMLFPTQICQSGDTVDSPTLGVGVGRRSQTSKLVGKLSPGFRVPVYNILVE